MEAFVIEGPTRLSGQVTVSGSKNAALPMLFAAILFKDEIKFTNVPRLWDVQTTLKILEEMGCQTQWDKDTGTVSILSSIKSPKAPYELVRQMRASILTLGPLLARCGEAEVSLPGGCAIGARPVNYHLEAMKKMGVDVRVDEGYVRAKVNTFQSSEYVFPQVSVTGTENVMCLAAAISEKTVLQNAAAEPEVVALGEMLVQAGANIEGLGTSTLEIRGSSNLKLENPVAIIADRIEAGTWIAASMITRSPLVIDQCDASHLDTVLSIFRSMGAAIEVSSDLTRLTVSPADSYQPIEIETQPYPGFATDMQAQLMTVACLAEGRSKITESIFENRFMHVAELQRLGASIEVTDRTAYVNGPVQFKGAPLMATDLRASASLVLAGLAATGTTKVSRIYHLDRGYQRLDEKLTALGARVKRISD